MKKRKITYALEEARIYHHHYQPSLNVVRFFKSVLAVMVSGSAAAKHTIDFPKKK